MHRLHFPIIHCLFTAVLLQHIVTCHGNTLLPQFLAMYRVTVESEDTYLLVMRNMFSHRLHVHRKYDLKVSPAGGLHVPFFASAHLAT